MGIFDVMAYLLLSLVGLIMVWVLIQEWREEIPSRIPCGSISTCAKIQRITSRPRP
jgi:hypothetical protein